MSFNELVTFLINASQYAGVFGEVREVLIDEEVNLSDVLNEFKVDFYTNGIKEPYSAQRASEYGCLKIKRKQMCGRENYITQLLN